MLSPAVIKPKAKMVLRITFVLLFIFKFHSKKAGMAAVVMSIIHASTEIR